MSSIPSQIEEKKTNQSEADKVNTITSLTVIVPVRNEELHIADTLDQLLDQESSGIRTEIVVVDGCSTDRTREIVQQYVARYSHIRLLHNPRKLSSAARNVAIEHTTSDCVVVIDGHCEIPSRSYFSDVVSAFEASGADCLGRPQPLDVSEATPLQLAIATARSSRLGHHPESFIYSDRPQFVPAKSVAVAYRREVFDEVGLFDERFDAHEDGELNFRCDKAGLKCYLDPGLAVKYFPRNTLGGLYRQMFRYGVGRIRLLRKYPESFSMGSVIPGLFVFGLLIGPLLSLAFPVLWVFYLSVLAVWLLAITAESVRLTWKSAGLEQFLWLPAVFTTIHIGSGAGLLSEILNKQHGNRSVSKVKKEATTVS